jgi:hypothetical protein
VRYYHRPGESLDKGGRRRTLGGEQRAVAVDLYRQKKHTIDEICRAVGISRPTIYKSIAAAGDIWRPNRGGWCPSLASTADLEDDLVIGLLAGGVFRATDERPLLPDPPRC